MRLSLNAAVDGDKPVQVQSQGINARNSGNLWAQYTLAQWQKIRYNLA